MNMIIDRAKLHSLYRYMLDWLYPNRCPCCHRIIEYNKDFCQKCADDFTVYTGDAIIPYVDKFTAYCVYDDNISPAILHFKHDDCGNSYYAFAYRIMLAINRDLNDVVFDYIVPIPMTKSSVKERGYNQSELMAKELRYMINVKYANALIKIRNTAHQKSLHKDERMQNLKGAFALSPAFSDVKGRNFLLIDDVCTTGSTFTETAKVLKENGAANVYAVSFAKTDKNRKGIPDADTSEYGEK